MKFSTGLVSAAFFSLLATAHAQAAPIAAVTEPESIWKMIESVGVMLIPLGLMSAAVISLIVFNFFWLRKANVASPAYLQAANRDLKEKNLDNLFDLSEQTNEMAAKVVAKAIFFARENPAVDIDTLKQVAEAEGGRQVARLNLPCVLLMDLGVMAPMFGLLGTVIGILRSFGTLASSDVTPMRSVILAGGVAEALVATTLGLAIGLTAMLFYAWFRGRVQGLIGYFEGTVTDLLARTTICLASPRK
jgi:biopolymer transport protein ExbB